MTAHETFMKRCIDLAKLGTGHVAPNPMVGAVLVYEDRIIGEGYHQRYGGLHAEVNCIGSVKPAEEELISRSILYVCLEPCAHFGKTPPCADLIIQKKIKKVVIGCRDPFIEVNGKGIEKLHAAGIDVITAVLEDECRELNKRFFTFHIRHRPYIILKWAQTSNGTIASLPQSFEQIHLPDDTGNARLKISNEYTNRLVHKWRSEESSILVGKRTALLDDPELTNRFWTGPSPLRLVVDHDLSLPSTLKMFNDQKAYTIVFNSRQHELDEDLFRKEQKGVGFYQVTRDVSLSHQIVHGLYQLKIISVFIEGGAQLIQSFIDEGLWDEARVITNPDLQVANGIPAPTLSKHILRGEEMIMSDQIHYFAMDSHFGNRRS